MANAIARTEIANMACERDGMGSGFRFAPT
jgi:hypothetical protein